MLKKEEHTITVLRANIAALIFSIPLVILSVLGYIHFWSLESLGVAIDFMAVWAIPIIIPGIILHELFHGLIWAVYSKKKWRAIRFGIKWTSMTPYCHCNEPLKKYHYFLGTAMPLFILGIIPIIISFLSGNAAFLIFGVLFSIAAGGDVYGLWILRKAKKKNWIQDHPDKIGFIILTNND
jgi:hypothetical protein